ncbi:hypothetical protein [Pseudoalteromonas luteoviolacea]|uniref:hypothetical protein n=1 Tax=Pseudoalteromonas luteoviolacea TaxID=43657 RepID=UPI001B38F9BE|nr:hypothetical protein [Pseudoalteromonas luteoviolacea]MBQ4839802.1 hypothetical protein [Pseudoalteromonas luteoviolacea]
MLTQIQMKRLKALDAGPDQLSRITCPRCNTLFPDCSFSVKSLMFVVRCEQCNRMSESTNFQGAIMQFNMAALEEKQERTWLDTL